MNSRGPHRTFCFDLDGTLCTNTWGEYDSAEPLPWAITRLNALKRAGHRIVIHTARGGTTGVDWRKTTEAQLRDWGVQYDELVFGKPEADVYVDDRTHHVDAWRSGEARQVGDEEEPPRVPVLPPPRGDTIVEVVRTFGGSPFEVEQHARDAMGRAERAGIVATVAPGEIEKLVDRLIQTAASALDDGDDLVLTIGVSGLPGATYLDTVDEHAPSRGVVVGSRPLSQMAAGLRRWLRPGGVSATQWRPDAPIAAWPVGRQRDGSQDLLGGHLLTMNDGVLRVPSSAEDVALKMALRSCKEAGVTVSRSVRPDTADADELILVGLPHCALPIVELDGTAVGSGRVGPAGRAILNGWRSATGIHPAEQISRLADR